MNPIKIELLVLKICSSRESPPAESSRRRDYMLRALALGTERPPGSPAAVTMPFSTSWPFCMGV